MSGDIKKVRDILVRHKGKANAIFSGEIARQIGITEGDTHSKVRALILEAIKKYKLPIAATTTNGYFYITNQTELLEYERVLELRKVEMEDRKNIVHENYIRKYGEIELGEED